MPCSEVVGILLTKPSRGRKYFCFVVQECGLIFLFVGVFLQNNHDARTDVHTSRMAVLFVEI
jgi:hypothetical protein